MVITDEGIIKAELVSEGIVYDYGTLRITDDKEILPKVLELSRTLVNDIVLNTPDINREHFHVVITMPSGRFLSYGICKGNNGESFQEHSGF